MLNIFINYMFLILEMCENYNYADDNTIFYAQDTPRELKHSLEHDAINVTDWFDDNGMKVNTEQYQGIIMFGVKAKPPMSFTMKVIAIECKNEVQLLVSTLIHN